MKYESPFVYCENKKSFMFQHVCTLCTMLNISHNRWHFCSLQSGIGFNMFVLCGLFTLHAIQKQIKDFDKTSMASARKKQQQHRINATELQAIIFFFSIEIYGFSSVSCGYFYEKNLIHINIIRSVASNFRANAYIKWPEHYYC